MKVLLFFEEKCTPGRQYLIRLAGLDFTALVARVLSISPRKLKKPRLFGVACKEQITMAGLILEGRSLKSHNTDTQPRSVQGVSEECNVGVWWSAKGKAFRDSLMILHAFGPEVRRIF